MDLVLHSVVHQAPFAGSGRTIRKGMVGQMGSSTTWRKLRKGYFLQTSRLCFGHQSRDAGCPTWHSVLTPPPPLLLHWQRRVPAAESLRIHMSSITYVKHRRRWPRGYFCLDRSGVQQPPPISVCVPVRARVCVFRGGSCLTSS